MDDLDYCLDNGTMMHMKGLGSSTLLAQMYIHSTSPRIRERAEDGSYLRLELSPES